MKQVAWAIALHGGASSLPKDADPAVRDGYLESLGRALDVGVGILDQDGAAIDAVEAVVVALENDPRFNAGKGAVFTSAGTHELDAAIMDGQTMRGGGVAGVRTLRNPITAARLVMEQSPHVLLAGPAADSFAHLHHCEKVSQDYFYTPEAFQRLQAHQKRNNMPVMQSPGYPQPEQRGGRQGTRDRHAEAGGRHEVGGTVGCVALDVHGNLAAATSTGGRTGKLPGRVGDSPILGAGTFADNQSCAVSGTGIGEEFIRRSIAARVGWLLDTGEYSLDQAVQHCLTNVLKPGDGGMIAVDSKGNLSLHANTISLLRAAADSTGRREAAIWSDR